MSFDPRPPRPAIRGVRAGRLSRFAPLIGAAAAILAGAAAAGDGRIEISQARVMAAGGFPYTIRLPGSYVLTSSLDAGAGGVAGTALRIEANGVFLDLNGFAVRGVHVCDGSGCPVGAGYGIERQLLLGGDQVTVINGEISGFGQDCVRLGTGAHLERLLIRSCGQNGAFIEEGSIVVGNRVSACGEFGLRMIGPVSFATNLLNQNGLGAGAGGPFQGGVSGGGNVCDGPCAPPPKRRFYATSALFNGANADNPGNCARGFHFASLHEISSPSGLEYDEALGPTLADAGAGPPALAGWVRTGSGAATGGIGNPGFVNCGAWGSALPGDLGTVVALSFTWDLAATVPSPWGTFVQGCNITNRVWCVED